MSLSNDVFIVAVGADLACMCLPFMTTYVPALGRAILRYVGWGGNG